MVGAKLECDFVPSIAYLEWCGIKLDQDKWKAKMLKDEKCLKEAECALNKFVTGNPKLNNYYHINNQGDLFSGFDTTPVCDINWSSSRQVVKLAKDLGFDVTVQDKKTGEDKESVLEKHLSTQKGVNDEFLKLYFEYQEYAKVVSSFGQSHLDAINPKTGRIHTVYKQLGASSGRMSCGSNQANTDLAKFKQLPASRVKYPNMQQLPHDQETRSCFVSEEGNLFCSCDYSAQEGRVQGDIYQDEAILKMYREGIDGHSMYAKIFFKDELKDIDVHDVKKLRPDLRSKAKGPEFKIKYLYITNN
jgi:DNA polymerase I-like protein with 3'-5' exonuclease and polymerase domains